MTDLLQADNTDKFATIGHIGMGQAQETEEGVDFEERAAQDKLERGGVDGHFVQVDGSVEERLHISSLYVFSPFSKKDQPFPVLG